MVLKDVPEMMIPKPVKAMLAAFIIHDWTGSSAQILSLKRGLGIETPDDMFWVPIASASAGLQPRDKVILLSDILPLYKDFSIEEAETDPIIIAVPKLLNQLVEQLATVCSELTPEEHQLIATDLIATDYVQPLLNKTINKKEERSILAEQTGSRIIRYVQSTSSEMLITILNDRRNSLNQN